MSRSLPVALSLLLAAGPNLAAAETGFRQVELDPGGDRPLTVTLWYPTREQGAGVTVGENAAFFGISARREAAPEPGSHPLVLLSHGYGGSWRNLNWLAEELVGAGYIVAAPDHPGTTTFNRDPAQAAAMVERPRDLSRATDALLDNPKLAGEVDEKRIAAIGHSLGGWTITALAGARFSPDQFATECGIDASPRACTLTEELGLNGPAIEADMRDPRIGAFVSLDLGLARGFTPESLGAIHAPALIIGAGVDVGDMPAMLESGWLGQHLPAESARLWILEDAIHFSFMQNCKPGAAQLIDEEQPGEGVVCLDGGARRRSELHAELTKEILAFLAQNLPLR